ncbi:MAG: hypothetical protein ACI959_000717 [Limisphaerales bacterium]|jgi:hypothetical protein
MSALTTILLRSLSLLILFAYAVGPSLQWVHYHQHDSEHVHLHSEENEANACHVNIYHGVQAGAECGHSHHYSTEQEECAFCDSFFQSPSETASFELNYIQSYASIKCIESYSGVVLIADNPYRNRPPPRIA